MVWKNRAKGSGPHGRDTGTVVLTAQTEHDRRGTYGRQCTTMGKEAKIYSAGPARSTRAPHKTTKERESATAQARAAANTEGRLGAGGGISGSLEYNVVIRAKRQLSQNEGRARRRSRQFEMGASRGGSRRRDNPEGGPGNDDPRRRDGGATVGYRSAATMGCRRQMPNGLRRGLVASLYAYE